MAWLYQRAEEDPAASTLSKSASVLRSAAAWKAVLNELELRGNSSVTSSSAPANRAAMSARSLPVTPTWPGIQWRCMAAPSRWRWVIWCWRADSSSKLSLCLACCRAWRAERVAEDLYLLTITPQRLMVVRQGKENGSEFITCYNFH